MLDIRSVCEDCGKEPKRDEEKSNENWNVYNTVCESCGGKVELKLK